MRVIVGKVWRAFPELDRFSDGQCERFVVAARRGAAAKRWQWPVLLVLGFIAANIAVGAGGLTFGWLESSPSPLLRQALVHFGLAGGAAVVVGVPCFWLVFRVRDAMLRRRIRYVIKARGSCPACGYFLGGVLISDGNKVICPECAMECTVDGALGELIQDEAGRARYQPLDEHLTPRGPWLTPARLKKWAKIAVVSALVLGFAGAAWWGIREWRLRVQAKLAAAERPGLAGAMQLVVDHQAPGVTEADANAYDVLAELLAKIATVEAQTPVPAGLMSTSRGYPTYPDYSLLMEELLPTDAGDEREENNRLSRARAGLLLEAQRAAGTFDLMRQMAACKRAERRLFTSAPGDPLIQVLLPDLGKCRQIARMNGGRMHLAVKAGDAGEFADALEVNLAVSRMIDHQPFLIDRLVSIAIEALCMNRVREALAAHPEPAWLDAIEGAFERQKSGVPFSMAYEGERLFGLDAAAWFYSDVKRVKSRNTGPLMAQVGWSVGTYTETRDRMKTLYGQYIADADLEHWQRPVRSQGPTGQWMIDCLTPPVGKSFRSIDQLTLERRGLTTMIALERYRLTHGQYPVTLEALVPGQVKALPLDPWSGKPLCYRRIDAAADPQKRGYLLWSVGFDGVDNAGQGIPGVQGNSQYESLHNDKHLGTDFIINDRER